jgi:hypothetical protein
MTKDEVRARVLAVGIVPVIRAGSAKHAIAGTIPTARGGGCWWYIDY